MSEKTITRERTETYCLLCGGKMDVFVCEECGFVPPLRSQYVEHTVTEQVHLDVSQVDGVIVKKAVWIEVDREVTCEWLENKAQ